MLRNVLALSVCGALAFGALTAASAESDPTKQKSAIAARTTGPANTPQLTPGGAAGIQQAQGFRNRIWNYVPFGLVTGLAALVVLATGDDDEGSATTTTTSSN